jgi:3-oxoacyl-[acyl-carrier protein] reductase
MDLALADKVVLVTGASGGIGRGLAAGFADEGARLVLVARTRAAALRAWIEERSWRDRAVVVEADVRSPESIAAAADAGVERWGRLDVAVTSAGVWPPEDRRLDTLPPERAREVIETNLLGTLWTARAFFSALARTGPRSDGHGASLVLIGSTAGRFGERGHADYAATKSALRGVALSLKNEIVELDPAGRVNLVEPGWTVTPMTEDQLADEAVVERVLATAPLARIGRVEDVVGAVLWLASPTAARHVTGETITVAGGMEGRRLRS